MHLEDGEPVRHSNDKKSSKIVFHVKNDGIFKISADWLLDDSAEKQVKNEFPTDIGKKEPLKFAKITPEGTKQVSERSNFNKPLTGEQKPGKPGNR